MKKEGLPINKEEVEKKPESLEEANSIIESLKKEVGVLKKGVKGARFF